MKKIILSAATLFALLAVGCTEDPITKPDLSLPEVEQVLAPAVAYISDTTLVQAVIHDPQGSSNIADVKLILNNPAGLTHELAMRDDGVNGDIIAADGQYVFGVTADEWQFFGMATLIIHATDAEGNSAEGDTVEIEVRSGTRGSAPEVVQITFADSIRIDSTYAVPILAEVQDANGLANIDSVIAEFYSTSAATPLLQLHLLDDGSSDDGVAGNGIFGAEMSSSGSGFVRAAYVLHILAIDEQSNKSKAATISFFTTQLGETAPEITSISAPDTLSRLAGDPIILRVQVADRNGLDDIRRVRFNSFLPNGTPSSGNPFDMRDDGIKDSQGFGDETADDGEYTAVIMITTSVTLGDYRFEFQAEDKSGLTSEKVNHTITVIE